MHAPHLRQLSRSSVLHNRLRQEAVGKPRPRRFSLVNAQLRLDRHHPDKGFDELPDEPGIYGVYDAQDKLQFLNITRKIRTSVMGHARDVPELTCGIGYLLKPEATREELQATWKELAEEYGVSLTEAGWSCWDSAGDGGDTSRSKAELRLTPGKGIDDLTVPIEKLIDGVVKSCKVVAFVKGTRTQPQCGFSYQMLSILNQNRVDYDVVDVLDEVYNPEVREKIKIYSQWPTIPQLYVNGEFVGGTDIIIEMQNSGELQKLLQQSR